MCVSSRRGCGNMLNPRQDGEDGHDAAQHREKHIDYWIFSVFVKEAWCRRVIRDTQRRPTQRDVRATHSRRKQGSTATDTHKAASKDARIDASPGAQSLQGRTTSSVQKVFKRHRIPPRRTLTPQLCEGGAQDFRHLEAVAVRSNTKELVDLSRGT